MRNHNPSVPCLSWYCGTFTTHTSRERLTAFYWVTPTNSIKALGLFHEVGYLLTGDVQSNNGEKSGIGRMRNK